MRSLCMHGFLTYACTIQVTLPIDEVPLVGPAASPNSRAQSAMVKLVEAARIITTATGIGIGFAGHYVPFSMYGHADCVHSAACIRRSGWAEHSICRDHFCALRSLFVPDAWYSGWRG